MRVAFACVVALAALAPAAGQTTPPPGPFIPASLLQAAEANPAGVFRVIVQGDVGNDSRAVASDVSATVTANPGKARGNGRRFRSISGVSAEVTGRQLVALSHRPQLLAITPDVRLAPAGGPVVSTPPSITGLAQAGQTLTALVGVWAGVAPLSYVFQWQHCDPAGVVCADIAGATGSTYTVAPADVGATLRVVVTVSDGTDSTPAVTAVTPVVAPAPVISATSPPALTSAPALSGTAQDGSTLTASSGDWTDASAYAYRWQRCSAADRPGAVLGSAPLGFWRLDDAGQTAADASGHGLSGTYSAGAVPGAVGVAGDDPAAALDGVTSVIDVPGLPNGVFSDGFTLEAWVKLDHPQSNVGIVGKWSLVQNDGALLWIDDSGHYGVAITQSTASYLSTGVAPAVGSWEHLVATWDGATIRLYRNGSLIGTRPFAGDPGVTTTDLQLGDYDGSGHRLSGALDEVAVYDRALSPVEVDGHAAGCRDLAGASGQTLALDESLLGESVRIVITATGAGGSTDAASEPSARIVPAPPSPVSAPTVIGTAANGRTLTAEPGSWTGTPPLAYSYQWQRCDAGGGSCVDVAGATGRDYTIAGADVGRTVRVVVTAGNGGGSVASASAAGAQVAAFSSTQMWPYAAGLDRLWPTTLDADPKAPAIAVVDSGVDGAAAGLGSRLVGQVTMTALTPNSPGDGRGHGTFVASVAAGSAARYAGAAPSARIVSLDVLDDNGMAMTSDVIAAVDWIYDHKDVDGIRVVCGVVVVAAAGNYAVDGHESGVLYAPGNDPFALTVGAADVKGTVDPGDDVAAPWSAYGHTPDGFAKPELGAPGRYIVAAVPQGATLPQSSPDRIVEPGYMQLSGTSFATAVVSGAVVALLDRHPDWTPDQVKGALMRTARATSAPHLSLGFGELDAAAAAAMTDPPNPNLALRAYIIPDPAGGPTPVFDAESWGSAAAENPAWAAESWGSESWGSESWGSESWGSESWGSESWGSSYWSAAAAAAGSSTTSLGADRGASVADQAVDDVLPAGGYWLTPGGR